MKTNWKRISSRAGGKVDRRSTKVATVYNLDTNPLASLSRYVFPVISAPPPPVED